MIDIILLTGFLGAGKTTFLQRLLEAYTQHKLGIIVNDFGEINVDAKLIQKEGMEMLELSNGSIFCACIKSKFVNGLVEMSKMDLDYLLIEASGLSDPANMEKLLEDIQSQTTHPLRLFASVCIVDAEYFLDLVDVLPALAQQVGYADAVIVNKADLADEETLTGIAQRIDELNQGVGVYCTSYCRVEIDELLSHLKSERKTSGETTNTVASRPSSFTLRGKESVALQGLEAFLKEIAPDTYRIKGFVMTDQGAKEVSAVGGNIQIHDWPEQTEETALVVISSVGVKLVSRILSASQTYLEGKLKL